MPIAALIALIQAGAQLAKSLPEIAEAVDQIRNPGEQAELRAALASWRASNEAGFARVDAKLAAAGEQ